MISVHRTDEKLAHGLAKRAQSEALDDFYRYAGKLGATRTVPAFLKEVRRAFGSFVLATEVLREKGSRAKAYALVLAPEKTGELWACKVSFEASRSPIVFPSYINMRVDRHMLARVIQRSTCTSDIDAAMEVVGIQLYFLAAHVIGLHMQDKALGEGDSLFVIGRGGKLCCTVIDTALVVKTWIPTKLINNPSTRQLSADADNAYIFHNNVSVPTGGLAE